MQMLNYITKRREGGAISIPVAHHEYQTQSLKLSSGTLAEVRTQGRRCVYLLVLLQIIGYGGQVRCELTAVGEFILPACLQGGSVGATGKSFEGGGGRDEDVNVLLAYLCGVVHLCLSG